MTAPSSSPGGALAFLALVVYVPPLAELFRFDPLGAVDLAICGAAGALSITWFEIVKLLGARRRARAGEDRGGRTATA